MDDIEEEIRLEKALSVLRDALPILRNSAAQEFAAEEFRKKHPIPSRWKHPGVIKRELLKRAERVLEER